MISRFAQLAGLLGPLALGATSLLAALAYRGTANEAYSPFNHWVSELGETGVSQLAEPFNVGLMISGVCFVVLMVGLGLARGGRLALLYAAIGAISGIAGILVGVYPMNFPSQHTIVAQAFFNLGWIAVLLASIDFWRRPDRRFPRWLSLLGVATVASFIGFLAAYYELLGDSDLGPAAGRPVFTIVTTLEWAVLMGMMAWAFGVAFSWWRAERAHGRA